ncbi:MAG TPA: tRNA (adenosine(37)-N6)-threonylcarbamoyltransferase complex transferase subunit TsaD [Patescibacteria group bacterium]|nr:tRNA (adenosine(37)-N6)-threonylcarbamoyltransferase complex transferase subunit TsaD [Patescibacteria group bacterium]
MRILGIETSCDDTSVALVETSGSGFVILAEKTASQIKVHEKYGGVVPEIAGRCHAENIVPVMAAVLANQPQPDVVASTAGPGLITGLLVGVEAAKVFSFLHQIPLIRVNHLEGHFFSPLLGKNTLDYSYPVLALIASGGHTELILAREPGSYEKIGYTKDDAAGECFDKAAKLLGLPYPGGPQISQLARAGRPDTISLPRPLIQSPNYDFSFAGLKTAVRYWVRDNRKKMIDQRTLWGKYRQWLKPQSPTIADLCASLEQAVVDVLTTKTIKAAAAFQPRTVILAGGVSANDRLRQHLAAELASRFPTISFLCPQKKYAMDNAAMIAAAAHIHSLKNEFTPWEKIMVDPNWSL